MFNSFLNKMFCIPSVSKRKMLGEPWRSRLFGEYYSPEKDDAYIFYLVFKAGLVIAIGLSLILWMSYKYHLSSIPFLPSHHVPNGKFVREFAWQFGVGFALLQFTFIYPYFYFLFKSNISWEEFRFSEKDSHSNLAKPELLKLLLTFRRVVVIFVILSVFGSWGVSVFIADRLHLHESVTYQILLMFFLPFLSAYFSGMAFRIFIVYLKCREVYRSAL